MNRYKNVMDLIFSKVITAGSEAKHGSCITMYMWNIMQDIRLTPVRIRARPDLFTIFWLMAHVVHWLSNCANFVKYQAVQVDRSEVPLHGAYLVVLTFHSPARMVIAPIIAIGFECSEFTLYDCRQLIRHR